MTHRTKTHRSKAPAGKGRSVIHTTLFQFIEAVNEVLPSGDDMVVEVIVNDILHHCPVGKRN